LTTPGDIFGIVRTMGGYATIRGTVLCVLIVTLVSIQRPAAQSSSPETPARPDALECLALTLYFEAGTERREQMLAVGWVVLNRRSHPAFPPTVCQVVRQGGEVPGCQFTYWCDGKADTPHNRRVWALAGVAAADLLASRTADPTGHALFFHAVSLRNVPWKVPRTKTTQIGRHIYYR